MEGALFTALDAENVAAIAGQIRATLQTLLRISAPRQPSRWLAACSAIVLASGPAAATLASGDAAGAETPLLPVAEFSVHTCDSRLPGCLAVAAGTCCMRPTKPHKLHFTSHPAWDLYLASCVVCDSCLGLQPALHSAVHSRAGNC